MWSDSDGACQASSPLAVKPWCVVPTISTPAEVNKAIAPTELQVGLTEACCVECMASFTLQCLLLRMKLKTNQAREGKMHEEIQSEI